MPPVEDYVYQDKGLTQGSLIDDLITLVVARRPTNDSSVTPESTLKFLRLTESGWKDDRAYILGRLHELGVDIEDFDILVEDMG